MLLMLAQATTRIGSPLLGYIIPAAVFSLSFFIAFYLYKHFTQKAQELDDRRD